MEGVGFAPGEYAPTVFMRPVRDLRCDVHEDGVTFVGKAAGLEWAASEMGGWHEIKVVGTLGPEDGPGGRWRSSAGRCLG